MASGVAVDVECLEIYNSIKENKKKSSAADTSPRYVIFFIENERMIKVEATGGREKSYDDFINDLTKHGDGDCRYGLFDYPYTVTCQGAGEAHKEKLVLFSWCPDTAKVKRKMIYSSSFEALKKKFEGYRTIQANGMDDLTVEEVEKVLRSSERS